MTQPTIGHHHITVQHRDGKPPWCNTCGRTASGAIPVSRFETKIGENLMDEDLIHTEDTLRKVYAGLMESGIYGQKAVDVVSNLQNQGILFRERRKGQRGRPRGSKNKAKEELKDPDGTSEIGPEGVAGNSGVDQVVRTPVDTTKVAEVGPMTAIHNTSVNRVTEDDPWGVIDRPKDAGSQEFSGA